MNKQQIFYEDEIATHCPVCRFHLKTTSEALIQRKWIEWQEKIAFEQRKQHEIAHRLFLEKQLEESRLRKQIRENLENELRKELGVSSNWFIKLQNNKSLITTTLTIVLFAISLIALAYFISKLSK